MESPDRPTLRLPDGEPLPTSFGDPPPPDGTGRNDGAAQDPLRAYRQEKLELAEVLLSLLHVAEARHDDARTRQIRSLAARLAEDRFQLAVVGQFSRGKSTLMNAILGAGYLPMGALPMTSVITTVVYGSRPGATILRRGNLLPIDTSIEDLPRYIAQASTDREELQVASAEIELPAEILRLGFSFVDTPGVGSAIVENTETTLSFLPEADALIFVTSFDSPLTEAELAFLRAVQAEVKRIFVILNKRDLVGELEADQVQEFVRRRFAELGLDDPSIFVLSARNALAAKERGDIGGLRGSGLAAFEAELVEYLTSEKAREFLLRIGERATRFIDAFSSEAEFASGELESEAVAQRVDQKLSELQARFEHQRRHLLETLGDVKDRSLDALVRDEAPKWAAALRTLAADARRVGDPPSGARPAGKREAVLPEPVAPWFDQRASVWLEGLEAECAPALLELARLPSAFESEIGREVGTTAPTEPAGDDQRWPRPQAGRHSWTLDTSSTPRAWWRRLRPPDPWRLVDQAADRHVQHLVDFMRVAADDWLARLDSVSGAEIAATAGQVRTRLLTPRSDAALGVELGARKQAIDESRRRVLSWTSQGSNDIRSPSEVITRPEPRERGAGCVVCERLVQVLFDFMSHYQFELATRIEHQVTHAAAGGFCPMHTWYYERIGSPMGVSASYARLGEKVAAALAGTADARDLAILRNGLLALQGSPETCPACRRLHEALKMMLVELRAALAAGGDVPPLCVGHVRDVLAAELDLEVARTVVSATAHRLARRADDMRMYALKRAALRRGLIDSEEEAAYHDVLVRLVGDPLLAGAPRHETE